ncbi:UPF0481 protein At3g47200-like [Cornus florida]|uniref:UPF0481 protein At3g47200-like n=1 Tax=Cornus florida TaxID=4283 RepID=UPI00289CE023|nr:UPF0481 protein At3g47200-like [Cornus florida]
MAEEKKSEFQKMLELLQRDIDENRSSNTESPPMAGELLAPRPRVHGMYRVPGVLYEQNSDSYRPSCVSIGPLWRGEEHLKEMEAVKKRYMGELLERNGTLAATLAEYTEAMFNLMSRFMECYSQILRWDFDLDYARDTMLDGCFIIELLYKNYVNMSDPILQNHLKYNQVRRDLLLLENQIPFFLLEELFTLTVEPIQKEPIWYKHKEKPTFKYSATKLHSMGVEFGPGKRVSLFDLKFTTDRRCFCLWRRAHFKIPGFSINESTESLLRNFIAFEHSCPGIDKYFTSYAFAMTILLDSTEDVKLLEEAGVIRNKLGFSEAVSELFKDITSNESINVRNQKLLYKDMWMQVMGFCTPWRLALANATTQMAVAAVIILNLITLLSSIYTVLSYYRN